MELHFSPYKRNLTPSTFIQSPHALPSFTAHESPKEKKITTTTKEKYEKLH